MEDRQLLSLVDLVSIPALPQGAGSSVGALSLSDDGRYVHYLSGANNQIAGQTDSDAYDDIYVRDVQQDVLTGITRVSSSTAGADANNNSLGGAISTDGQSATFASWATNLVTGDNPNRNWAEIFVKQRGQGGWATTTLVSTNNNGDQADDRTLSPSISGDGFFVAFQSLATNLVSGSYNGKWQIYMRDRQQGGIGTIWVTSDSSLSNRDNERPSISADGHYVAFQSIPYDSQGNATGPYDIFVVDITTTPKTLTRVTTGDHDSLRPVITDDGQGNNVYVAFDSLATNLVSGGTNGNSHVYRWQKTGNNTVLWSQKNDGTQGNADSDSPSISADGQYIAFDSNATNLASGATNGDWEILVNTDGGDPALVSADSTGTQLIGNKNAYNPAISADGHYIAFQADSATLFDVHWDTYTPPQGQSPPSNAYWAYNIYREMNPLSLPTTVTIAGTSGDGTHDDTFAVSTDQTNHTVTVTWGASGSSILYRKTAQTWTIPVADDPLSVTFIGNGGNDTLSVTGAPNENDATLHGTSLTYQGNRTPNTSNYAYQVSATGIKNIYLDNTHTTSRLDCANIYDSSGTDTFWTDGASARLTDGTIDPDTGELDTQSSYTYYNELTNFYSVYARRTAGGTDTAYFRHAANDNQQYIFHARSYQSYLLTSQDFFVLASDFNNYWGYGQKSKHDEALFGTAAEGHDTFTAGPDPYDSSNVVAVLSGTDGAKSFELHATGFETYVAYRATADSSTNDTATITGTTGNDSVTFAPNDTVVTLSNGVTVEVTRWSGAVRGFDQVTVIGNGGSDTATLNGTTGNDAFIAQPGSSEMDLSTGAKYFTTNVANVYVVGAGGNDTATLTGASSGTNTFWGKLTDAVLSDGTLNLTTGELTAANTYYFHLTGFDTTSDSVSAIGPTGATNDRHLITPIDYTLAFTGTWIDI